MLKRFGARGGVGEDFNFPRQRIFSIPSSHARRKYIRVLYLQIHIRAHTYAMYVRPSDARKRAHTHAHARTIIICIGTRVTGGGPPAGRSRLCRRVVFPYPGRPRAVPRLYKLSAGIPQDSPKRRFTRARPDAVVLGTRGPLGKRVATVADPR